MDHQTALADLVRQIPSPGSNGADARPANITQNNNQSDVRLQRIEIPKFDGNYKNWPEFHDLFKNLIHNNTRLSSCEKFQYLKRSLIGSAQGVLKNMTISDANYLEAYKELLSTFDKKEVIIDSYLQTIMNQDKLQTASSDGLRLLCTNMNESVRALKAFDLPTEHWDRWLIFILSTKLDTESLKLWRRELSQKKSDETTTFAELVMFINTRIYELTPGNIDAKTSTKQNVHYKNKQANTSSVVSNSCFKCHGEHGLYTCPDFLNLSIKKRKDYIKEKGLCFNCLKAKHMVKQCESKSGCKICKFKHNTLLHEGKKVLHGDRSTESNQIVTNTVILDSDHNTAILPTAIVNIKDYQNQYQKCRILLDTGSQINLISENCVQRLGLKRKQAKLLINGVGSTKTDKLRGKIDFQLKSMFNEFETSGQAFILTTVTQNIPSENIRENLFTSINLADPHYAIPSKIDMILGSDMFFEILQNGKIDNGPNVPMAQETKFGWIVSGRGFLVNTQKQSSLHTCINIDQRLKSFWELEELPNVCPETTEEMHAEEHFSKNHTRDNNGRYILRLPFKNVNETLGVSYNSALSTLKSVERRFERDPTLKSQYTNFMREYLELHHMVQVPVNRQRLAHNQSYYLPHHAVLKENSSTTKLRVVFDGSRKTSTGISLNQLLMVGPTIQKDIWFILLNFRKYKIAYTADIAKMYRQIMIDQQVTPFQRILWRESKDDDVKEYELRTVTYGTASAPFAAIRTLKQLTLDEGQNYQLGFNMLLNNFYVHDFMGGSNTLEEAKEIKQQLIILLQKGGFDLRKWASNSTEFLETIDKEHREMSVSLPLEEDASIKVLGLVWHPAVDHFTFKVNLQSDKNFTKRNILSEISRIYDPLGLLAPCVIIGKILMQEIWASGVGWDDMLPNLIIQKYTSFRIELNLLSSLQIPRHLGLVPGCQFQICGFADASESAFAAVVYLRIQHNDLISVKLLVSKTRVAPIKQISIPRLELAAAHLLANLIEKLRSTMSWEMVECYAFMDSTVMLAWLKTLPKKWKTYIANRTSKILEVLPYKNWRHVQSNNNAADPASRGLLPSKLITSDIWWNGPQFLYTKQFNQHPIILKDLVTNLEERKVHVGVSIVDNISTNQDLIQRYSNLQKLISVTARCNRFIFNARAKQKRLARNVDDVLHVSERQSALIQLIISSQVSDFKIEIQLLSKDKPLQKGSKLFGLSPFIDLNGVLRVGGRLQESNLNYNKKHPIILSKSHHLTVLIVQELHHKYFHANQQLMMNALLLRYWIVGGKHAVKKCIHQCPTCQRHRAEGFKQQMGNLPSHRVQPGRPFTNTGTDFAGPFQEKA